MSATKLPSPESLAALVSGVTETMLGIRFDLLPQSREAPTDGWRAAVIPIEGDRKLAVAVAADLSSARDLTSAIFYCEPNEVEVEMIDDALRELSNIVAGQVKVTMNVDDALGLPKIIEPGNNSWQPPSRWQAATLQRGGIETRVWVAVTESFEGD